MSNFKELVRIGKDAEVRVTHNGKPVVGFSAAFDNGWGDKKQTVWLDCTGWGERYEKIAEYIIKGSQAVVEGDIGTREWEGKTYITLNLSDVKLVRGSRDSEDRKPAQQAKPRPAPAKDSATDDEIPF